MFYLHFGELFQSSHLISSHLIAVTIFHAESFPSASSPQQGYRHPSLSTLNTFMEVYKCVLLVE